MLSNALPLMRRLQSYSICTTAPIHIRLRSMVKLIISLMRRISRTSLPVRLRLVAEGHVYFISIPHGILFATMQDDEGTIVRNENMDTLCRGLYCNGAEYNYKSVRDLMRSPIGRYCNAVVRKGKLVEFVSVRKKQTLRLARCCLS